MQQVTRYQYDEAGNEVAQIDALNRTNTYGYDGQGRKIAQLLPGGQGATFGYDLCGNQVYATNFNGLVITNKFDALNRLTNVVGAGGYNVAFSYTATGQRQSMVDGSGTNAYSYDTRDRLAQRVVNWRQGPSLALNYRYDANGSVTNLWSGTPNGVNLAYAYDAQNRLTNVLANGQAAAGYGFDLVGNMQSLRYGNGVTNAYQYDSLNRLTNLVWWTNGTVVGSFGYGLGWTGNRTNLSESLPGAVSRSYQWQYDTLYRLTNEVVPAGVRRGRWATSSTRWATGRTGRGAWGYWARSRRRKGVS